MQIDDLELSMDLLLNSLELLWIRLHHNERDLVRFKRDISPPSLISSVNHPDLLLGRAVKASFQL